MTSLVLLFLRCCCSLNEIQLLKTISLSYDIIIIDLYCYISILTRGGYSVTERFAKVRSNTRKRDSVYGLNLPFRFANTTQVILAIWYIHLTRTIYFSTIANATNRLLVFVLYWNILIMKKSIRVLCIVKKSKYTAIWNIFSLGWSFQCFTS